ncbi:MAG: cation transporter, partial [Bacteroidota bacterium]|nr:cation transporter [Bacteroidota bacterium]
LTLIASGKQMQSDTYATAGVVVGLIIVYLTDYVWIDSVVSLLFAFIIIITGYTILRDSLAGIMDEADKTLLTEIVTFF